MATAGPEDFVCNTAYHLQPSKYSNQGNDQASSLLSVSGRKFSHIALQIQMLVKCVSGIKFWDKSHLYDDTATFATIPQLGACFGK